VLRINSYSYKCAGREQIEAKDIRRHVVRNHLTFEGHKCCLFEVNDAIDGDGSEEVGSDGDDFDNGDFGDDAEWKDEEMRHV